MRWRRPSPTFRSSSLIWAGSGATLFIVGDISLDEAVAVASHKSNVWLNLVGTDGRSFLEDFDGVDVGRCLFGSDWCFASLDAALAGWKVGSVDDETRRRILHDNAARLLEPVPA